MSENVQTAMFEILKRIQAELSSFRAEVNARFEASEKRFDEIGDLVRKQRRDTAGLLVMPRPRAGSSPRTSPPSRSGYACWKPAAADLKRFARFRFTFVAVGF